MLRYTVVVSQHYPSLPSIHARLAILGMGNVYAHDILTRTINLL